MTPDIQKNVARIVAFNNVQDGLLQLDEDAAVLFESGKAKQYLTVLFELFERLPEEDNEVFWGIMHGLEDIDGYEAELINSISRQPSTMGIIMINRILNNGEDHIGDVNLLELLRATAANPASSDTVRQWADDFVAHQTRKQQ